jgi:hypothetical protein
MTTRPIAAGDIATALGGPGTAGQLVGSNGTTPQWVAPASAVTNYPDNRLFLISCVATNIVPLTATYSNGTAGVGATLTATAPGALVLDGYTPHVGDNVLIGGDETQTPHNGVYVVTTVGDGSHPYVLTRHAHCNQPAHFVDLWVVTSDWGNTLWAQFFLQELVVNTVGSDNVYFDPRGAGADARFNHLGHGLQIVSGGAGVFTLSVSGLTTADIGGFNAAVSAAAPVQSVAGRTGAVAFTSNDVTTALAYTPTYTRAGIHGHQAHWHHDSVLCLCRQSVQRQRVLGLADADPQQPKRAGHHYHQSAGRRRARWARSAGCSRGADHSHVEGGGRHGGGLCEHAKCHTQPNPGAR